MESRHDNLMCYSSLTRIFPCIPDRNAVDFRVKVRGKAGGLRSAGLEAPRKELKESGQRRQAFLFRSIRGKRTRWLLEQSNAP